MSAANTPKRVIIIAGPTAVGKTAVAIRLARHFNTEIISADSRQCYRELNIGVARPSQEELDAVPHHFIASHSIHEKITAAYFEAYALQKAQEIFSKRDVVIMVGGTGLYIKAFCEGMDKIPEVPESIRSEVLHEYGIKGLSWLQQEIMQLDPAFYEKGEIHNPQRLMRALEVHRTTGKSILEFRKQEKAQRDFDITRIALQLPKEQLRHNIDTRVDAMIEHGLFNEVQSLIPYQHLNALQTVGYKEVFDYFNGMHSADDARALIKKNTWQYARRQMTWFRKNGEYRWMEAGEVFAALTGEIEPRRHEEH